MKPEENAPTLAVNEVLLQTRHDFRHTDYITAVSFMIGQYRISHGQNIIEFERILPGGVGRILEYFVGVHGRIAVFHLARLTVIIVGLKIIPYVRVILGEIQGIVECRVRFVARQTFIHGRHVGHSCA